eukprot:TRINITY_DN13323_c0_g2_i2.p1 TRINITY_DN13323_c0_g2~~TRINITY_DN13323_c0_g2_i2.p1  ORF type:complete len:429 (+),score=83.16 TRINITY_DN13323_c0_g2_i2:193-1479(+)
MWDFGCNTTYSCAVPRVRQCGCEADVSDNVNIDMLPAGTAAMVAVDETMQDEELGFVSYNADISDEVAGSPIRVGQVLHLATHDKQQRFEPVTLRVHCNGFTITPETYESPSQSVALSPFSLVQACRMHTMAADDAASWMRLFKVVVFQFSCTHFFATIGDQADEDRARWVADISQVLRTMTISLLPRSSRFRTDPLPKASWTATRLLAGYLLLCDDEGVSVVYCELHGNWDSGAAFVAYENVFCQTQVLKIRIQQDSSVSERVGVDCSCFAVTNYSFTARSCAEKMLWLRAISNVKVKLRHTEGNPTQEDLEQYRLAISESVLKLSEQEIPLTSTKRTPLLRRRPYPLVNSAAEAKVAATNGPQGPVAFGSSLAAVKPPVGLCASADGDVPESKPILGDDSPGAQSVPMDSRNGHAQQRPGRAEILV